MQLLDTTTGEYLDALIEPVTAADFTVIKKSKSRFDKFDWSVYRGKEVYKLHLEGDESILGLMCLIDHMDEETNAIEIDLLEVSADNIGSNKKLDKIGGCLIAFACRESFVRGHGGVIFLTPKTQLLNHYPGKYGFIHFPLTSLKRPEGLMLMDQKGEIALIKKYLD